MLIHECACPLIRIYYIANVGIRCNGMRRQSSVHKLDDLRKGDTVMQECRYRDFIGSVEDRRCG